MPDSEEARSYRVDLPGVELEEIPSTIDQYGSLKRLFGEMVVSDTIMGEIVEDFEGKEIAGSGDVAIPTEYRSIYYLNMICMVAGRCCTSELLRLKSGQCR